MSQNKKAISDFTKLIKWQPSKCLDPTMSCQAQAIRAHSVQNATSLAIISENDHVYELKPRIINGEPSCMFHRVGRNEASTFLGMCNQHDTEIFKPIDTKPLEVDDSEQLFLLAYRAVTRELHAAIAGAMRLQRNYRDSFSRLKPLEIANTLEGEVAAVHTLKAWGIWKYRSTYFDIDLGRKMFKNIKHTTIKIRNEKPVIAASSLFSVDNKPWGRPFAGVTLNIVPTNESETLAIFSYPRKHSGRVRKYIARIVLSSASCQKYELSYMLLNKTENFFVSPRAISHWSDEKSATSRGHFCQQLYMERNYNARQI
ncbi:MAG: hypothetical protein P9C48_08335 [Defluviicoccus sp.]|nr:hypothetical protein [Defluviicoccus sp.]MDG4609123.1 hypothetical protein [Defluviicoccus sp.]